MRWVSRTTPIGVRHLRTAALIRKRAALADVTLHDGDVRAQRCGGLAGWHAVRRQADRRPRLRALAPARLLLGHPGGVPARRRWPPLGGAPRTPEPRAGPRRKRGLSQRVPARTRARLGAGAGACERAAQSDSVPARVGRPRDIAGRARAERRYARLRRPPDEAEGARGRAGGGGPVGERVARSRR